MYDINYGHCTEWSAESETLLCLQKTPKLAPKLFEFCNIAISGPNG